MPKQTSTAPSVTKTSRTAYKAHMTRASKETERVLGAMREAHETYVATMARLYEELATCEERAAATRARYEETITMN
jgi:hypothetical protein